MFLLFTILAVSVDAYLASLAYGVKNKLTIPEILYASTFTFLLCGIALLVSDSLSGYAQLLRWMGAGIFLLLGIKNFLPSAGSESQPTVRPGKRGYADLTALGLGIAADAALACLTIRPDSLILCAFLMCAAHFAFICCGMATARDLPRISEKLPYVSGLFLIALGLYRLLA